MLKTNSWQFYIRINPVLAVELEELTYVKIHGLNMSGKKGDYLCSNKERTEQWIVKPYNFHKLYKLTVKKSNTKFKTWNLYNEKPPIKAKQLNKRMTLQNKENRKIGEKGDYLCSNDKGAMWIIPQKVMHNEYKQLTRKNNFCW